MKELYFKKKNDCCGCGACINICPKGAMELQNDEYGFKYPVKNKDICIDCGLCDRVCNFKREKSDHQFCKEAYAVVSKNSLQAKKSSSGGIFAALAEYIISQGGYVCGASWSYEDGGIRARHIIIDKIDDIRLLQGSKYVQSDTDGCYKEIRGLLNEGKSVLFSGTPCQVDGLKGYLRNDYENLITLDIVCHGVPNAEILSAYLRYNWEDWNISELSFRDKKMGWGMTGYVKAIKNGKEKTFYITPKNSSYFSEFINGSIYRDNCYECPYAGYNRPADITIGDFWGVMEEHAEYAKDMNDAISAVVLNTEKAKKVFEHMHDSVYYCKSSFEKIAVHNSQLREPSICPPNREILLDSYAQNGYKAIEDNFVRQRGKKSIKKENIKLFIKSHRIKLST